MKDGVSGKKYCKNDLAKLAEATLILKISYGLIGDVNAQIIYVRNGKEEIIGPKVKIVEPLGSKQAEGWKLPLLP